MMKAAKYLWLFVFLCYSCNQRHGEIIPIKIISIDNSFDNNLHLDSIVDTYTLIELETTDEFLLGRITQIEYVSNRFYISDRDNNTLIAFNRNGKAIYRLSSVGRGPDGFSNISCFQVASDHNLYVLSGFKGIVSFDSTGKYKKSINHNSLSKNYAGNINSFALTGTGGFYLWNGTVGIDKDSFQGTYHIYTMSKNGKITSSYLPIHHGFFGTINIFYGQEGNYLLQTLNGNDTIYRADQYGISPAYYVDFGRTKIASRSLPVQFENYLKEFSKIRNNSSLSTSINSPIETEDFLFFQFYNSRILRFAFYSLESEKVITGTFPFSSLLGWTKFNCSANNQLVGYIEPSKIQLVSAETRKLFSPLEEEIYQKIASINPSNNPILILLDLKDF